MFTVTARDEYTAETKKTVSITFMGPEVEEEEEEESSDYPCQCKQFKT